MDKLSSMDRERVAAEGVTRDNFKIFEEELSRDKYGTREVPTVSPLASDKPLQHAYKWFSAAERLANSGAPNLNFDNLVRKANEHISMVETSHLGPESPRTEAEQYSLGRRVSNWKKLVARWEEAAVRSAEPAAAAARGPPDDVSDAGHVPEALPEAMPDAFTEAAEWFRAARTATQAVYKLDPEELSAFSGAGIRHVDSVKALMSSWPPSVRGTIRGSLMKWEMLIMRWMTAAAEVQLVYGFDAETAKIAKMRRGFLDSLQASQQEYREKQLLKRTCSLCGKTAALSSRAFSYCSGCRDADVAAGGVRVRWHWARYCSDECQRAHWLARHADECPCAHGDG